MKNVSMKAVENGKMPFQNNECLITIIADR